MVLHPLKSVRIVSVFGDRGLRCASCKNEEHGEKDAEDDDRNFVFSEQSAPLHGLRLLKCNALESASRT